MATIAVNKTVKLIACGSYEELDGQQAKQLMAQLMDAFPREYEQLIKDRRLAYMHRSYDPRR